MVERKSGGVQLRVPEGLENVDWASIDPRITKIVCSDLPKSHARTMGLFGEEGQRQPAITHSKGPVEAARAQQF